MGRHIRITFLVLCTCLNCGFKEYEKREIALVSAAEGGDLDAVELLLEKGVDVNVTAWHRGMTALHVAAENGHEDVLSFLIVQGADIFAKDDDGKMPIHYAAGKGHMSIAKLFLAKGMPVDVGYPGTPLLFAVYHGQKDMVVFLLSKGANPRAKVWWHGYSVLHEAVNRNQIEIAKILVENGADINEGGFICGSPLEEALKYKPKVAEALKKQ